jgi:hypothetical protein
MAIQRLELFVGGLRKEKHTSFPTGVKTRTAFVRVQTLFMNPVIADFAFKAARTACLHQRMFVYLKK